MPEQTISPGDTEQLYTAQRARESLFIRVQDNGNDDSIHVAKTEQFARDGRQIQADDRGDMVFTEAGEPVHVHAPSSNTGDVTVTFESQGFFLNYAPRKTVTTVLDDVTVANVPVDIDAASVDVPITIQANNAGNIATSIEAANATVPINIDSQTLSAVDFNLSGQDINMSTEIAAQTISQVDIDENIQSSLGKAESNDDQTTSLTGGSNQITTIRANSGEQWELKKIFLKVSDPNGDSHRFIIRTEQSGTEVGRGGASASVGLEYSGGEWVTGDNQTTDDMKGTQIDDTNGLEVEYQLDGTADQSDTRTIRTVWEVIQN